MAAKAQSKKKPKSKSKLREIPVESGAWVGAHLNRLADAIAADIRTDTPVVLAGIRRRGPALAARLAKQLTAKGCTRIQHGAVDVRFERDDIALRGPVTGDGGTKLPALHGITVILVDDVLHTGRTVRAALSEIMNFGRPAAIRLAVLIDRGGREMPIQADYVGAKKSAGQAQAIVLRVKELDKKDGVFLVDLKP